MLTTYKPGDVRMTVGGSIMHGFADGTFINVEYDEDAVTKTMGADGECSRSISSNTSGRITMTLMQTSDSNGVLSLLAIADRQSGGGIVPVTVTAGQSVYAAAQAWVVKMPPGGFEKEATTREWNLDCASLDVYEGGYEGEA